MQHLESWSVGNHEERRVDGSRDVGLVLMMDSRAHGIRFLDDGSWWSGPDEEERCAISNITCCRRREAERIDAVGRD